MKYKRWFLLCTGELVLEEDAWKFPGSHILGDLRRMTMEGASVTSLALWLTPADCEHVPPFNPEIVAYLIGDARLIRCRFDGCGNQQRWEMGRDAVLAWLEKLGLIGIEGGVFG